MAALHSTCGHYIFYYIIFLPCGFLFYLSSFFFPRLISAIAEWMSITLLHYGVALVRIYNAQVLNVLHDARWKYRKQKRRKKSPFGHHRTNLSGLIFATKAYIGNRKKLVKQQYVLRTFPQYGELRPTSGWDRFGSLGHPSNFQRLSRLGSVRHTAHHSICSSVTTIIKVRIRSWFLNANKGHILKHSSCSEMSNCTLQQIYCWVPWKINVETRSTFGDITAR